MKLMAKVNKKRINIENQSVDNNINITFILSLIFWVVNDQFDILSLIVGCHINSFNY